MTLPGVEVTSRESPPSRSLPIDTGTWFVAGFTERGSVSAPILVRSIDEVISKTGARQSWSAPVYDALETFFREGGFQAYIGRVVGPAPVVASGVLDAAGAVDTLEIDAVSPGAWANTVHVLTTAGSVGGTFVITVKEGTVTKEVSPDLADGAAAVAWAADSDYIRLTDLAAGDPVAGQDITLAGGNDDRTNAGNTEFEAALTRFSKDLGPGQVSIPGRTTTQAHTDLLEHAEAKNRFALLDLADTAVVGTLNSAAAAARALSTARYGAAFAPWAEVPGITGGTTRLVPWSAVQAGLIARSESKGNSPNVAAAGENGQAAYALDLSQESWTDADRESLNDGGVNVARMLFGGARTYGYRTLVDPLVNDAWLQITNARLNMLITAQAEVIAERFLFAQLDGKRRKISDFGGELKAMLAVHHEAGALYGDTPDEAYLVDVGPQVNTEQTIANRELKAILAVRMSPFGERVNIEIAKVANTEAL